MDILQDNKNFTLSEDINGPVLSAFVGLVMVTGFVANLFVIIVTFCHPKSLKQSSTVFLTSLLLADLVLVVFVMPFSVISTASGEWIFGQSTEQKYGVCQFVGIMFWYGDILIVMTLALISVDRFLFIVKPFFHKKYIKPRTAVVTVLIVWISCAVLSTAPIFKIGIGQFAYGVSMGVCVPIFEGNPGFLAYGLCIFVSVISCIVITTILTYCYVSNFFANDENRFTTSSAYTNRQRKLTGVFGILLIANAVCFFPSIVVGALATALTLPRQLYAATFVCFLFATVANPLIQSFFRPDIKNTIRNMCRES